MLSIHNIKRIRARATESPEAKSNWVELHIQGGYVLGPTENLMINLYFNSPELARAFYEAYPDKLTTAELHAVRWAGENPTAGEPEYPADHPAPGDLGSVPL